MRVDVEQIFRAIDFVYKSPPFWNAANNHSRSLVEYVLLRLLCFNELKKVFHIWTE